MYQLILMQGICSFKALFASFCLDCFKLESLTFTLKNIEPWRLFVVFRCQSNSVQENEYNNGPVKCLRLAYPATYPPDTSIGSIEVFPEITEGKLTLTITTTIIVSKYILTFSDPMLKVQDVLHSLRLH